MPVEVPSQDDIQELRNQLADMSARLEALEGGVPAPGDPNGSTWLGIQAPGDAPGSLSLTGWEAALGRDIKFWHRKVSQVSWAAAARSAAGRSSDPTSRTITNIFDIGAIAPNSQIAAGTWDTEITTVFQNFIDAGHGHSYIRLNHEADQSNKAYTFLNGKHTDYIAAWQRVHGIAMGLTGAEFKWQYGINGPAGAQGTQGGTLMIEIGYPGDPYVDSVAVGNYNRNQYQQFSEVLIKLNFVKDFAVSHGKKFDIPEWGLRGPTAGGLGDNPSFIQDTFDWFSTLPDETRGYCLYFNAAGNATDGADLNLWPNSKALFTSLFEA